MCRKVADKGLIAGVAVLLIAVAFSSCASAPKVNIPENSVSVTLVDRKELVSRFGPGQNYNPFLAPQNAFLGFPYEFVVLKLTTNFTAMNTKLGLKATVVDETGQNCATMLDAAGLTNLWSAWPLPDSDSSGTALLEKRQFMIESNAIPGPSFPAPSGAKEYYIVLKGGNPLPRPGKITVEVTMGKNEAPSVYSFDVPAKTK